MSLIMPIMVNTTEIGYLVIGREENFNETLVHEYGYTLRMYERDDLINHHPAKCKHGTLTHHYDDGAIELLKKVFKQL